MRRIVAVVASVLGGVLLMGAGGYVYVGSAAAKRLSRKFEVTGKDIPIPYPLTSEEIAALQAERSQVSAAAAQKTAHETPSAQPAAAVSADAAPLSQAELAEIARERAVERGRTLVRGRLACAECHGESGVGKLIVDAQPVWTWYAPNITRGGRTRNYTSRDWDRILRHGVKSDGTPATMPAMDFVKLSDQEVSDLAAYFTYVEPSDVVQPKTVLGPVGKALIALGKLPISAEQIDHTRPHASRPPRSTVDVAFGEHVAATCVGCHRSDFSGGPIAQGPPDWPAAGNLTPHAEGLSGWSEADFVRVLREGQRPDGSRVREPMLAITKLQLSDTEVRAMFAYLRAVPAKATGQ